VPAIKSGTVLSLCALVASTGTALHFTPLFSCCESDDLNVRLYVSKIVKTKLLTKTEYTGTGKDRGWGKGLLAVNTSDLTHVSNAYDNWRRRIGRDVMFGIYIFTGHT